ncbi:MAG: hypothetical protein DDT32_02001 [Syntrophomonadaceae bacterium]|nr:hypothetical protein [Bacillota bacterium]
MVVACPEKNGQVELERRRSMVVNGLRRLDLTSRSLTTEELADILYVIYNKTRANTARLQDVREHGFFAPVIQKIEKTRSQGADRVVP